MIITDYINDRNKLLLIFSPNSLAYCQVTIGHIFFSAYLLYLILHVKVIIHMHNIDLPPISAFQRIYIFIFFFVPPFFFLLFFSGFGRVLQ